MASPMCDVVESAATGRPQWETILAEAVRSPQELCRRLGLAPALAAEAAAAARDFSVLVPRPYLDRIRPGDPDDPLLRQVLPRAEERTTAPGFVADPLGEFSTAADSSLLQKYQGRILIVTSGRCGVHCRFCFRRHFPYETPPKRGAGWANAVASLTADPSISEVILSGGDPLALPDRELAAYAAQLAEIPHLRRIRVHTRLPVMIPQRVNEDLLDWLRGGRLTPFVVVQVNHPAEIDADVAAAFARLVDAGVPMLNQAVLLRGVNDRVEILAELCQRLIDLRVLPYYLHQLDPVAGAAHFEVSPATGAALMAELRARLPGYAVPRYVRETRHGACKEPLA